MLMCFCCWLLVHQDVKQEVLANRDPTLFVTLTRATLGVVIVEHDAVFFARHYQLSAAFNDPSNDPSDPCDE